MTPKQVAPNEPIAQVLAQDLDGFEGGLFWLKNKKEWVVLYKEHEDLPGRSNFTIAHEFGHYVLHRKTREEFQCSSQDTLGIGRDIEREADEFASYLLMPLNDFSAQVAAKRITLDVLGACADRYEVSLTAATLKWLSFTDQAAILVAAREGMVLWWRPSGSAKQVGMQYFRSGMELPQACLAVSPAAASYEEFRSGADHAKGVWLPHEPVREMAIISDRYDMTLSLLVFSKPGITHDEEPDEDMTTQPPRF